VVTLITKNYCGVLKEQPAWAPEVIAPGLDLAALIRDVAGTSRRQYKPGRCKNRRPPVFAHPRISIWKRTAVETREKQIWRGEKVSSTLCNRCGWQRSYSPFVAKSAGGRSTAAFNFRAPWEDVAARYGGRGRVNRAFARASPNLTPAS